MHLIEERLQTALDPQQIIIRDDSQQHAGHAAAKAHGGGHYSVEVVSSKFDNKSTIERHKMIYMALGDAIGKEIHAISIKAKTPAEAAIHNASP